MTQRPNLYDYLKIIALLSMIIDHIGYFLYPDIWLRVIGRLAFPLFLLLVGYNGSYKRRSSLWIVGIIVQLSIWCVWFSGLNIDPMLNILLVIACTRVFLGRVTRQSREVQLISFVFSIALFPLTRSRIDYGTLAISFGLAGWWLRTYTSISSLRAWMASIVTYLWFMIIYRGFPQNTWNVLLGIGVFIFIAGALLATENRTYRISYSIDRIVTIVSTYALWIYVLHGGLIFLVRRFSH